ncbi:MAG: hypothetical protein ACPF9D_08945, partial [Owenweeksia sp.]
DSVMGDLNGDNIVEKAVVYHTTDSAEDGIIRELHILKRKNGHWELWQSSRSAVRPSEDGGIMGDPYGGMYIKDGILEIQHFGGSSWKWGYTDKYRFQNDHFELIGHSGSYGRPCDYLIYTDFNLSTGKIIWKKEIEECDEEGEYISSEASTETFCNKDIHLNLSNRHEGEIRIPIPHTDEAYYLH